MRNILGILTKIYDIMSSAVSPAGFSGLAADGDPSGMFEGKRKSGKIFLPQVWNFKMMCYIMQFINENTIQEIMIWQIN